MLHYFQIEIEMKYTFCMSMVKRRGVWKTNVHGYNKTKIPSSIYTVKFKFGNTLDVLKKRQCEIWSEPKLKESNFFFLEMTEKNILNSFTIEIMIIFEIKHNKEKIWLDLTSFDLTWHVLHQAFNFVKCWLLCACPCPWFTP